MTRDGGPGLVGEGRGRATGGDHSLCISCDAANERRRLKASGSTPGGGVPGGRQEGVQAREEGLEERGMEGRLRGTFCGAL